MMGKTGSVARKSHTFAVDGVAPPADFFDPGLFEIHEDIFQLPGKGFYCGVDFKNGLRAYFYQVNTDEGREKCLLNVKDAAPVMGFRFCLSGNKKIKMPAFREDIFIRPNYWEFFYFRDECFTHQYRSNDFMQIFFITIDPGYFLSVLGEERDLSGIGLPRSKGDGGRPFNLSSPISVEARISLAQMFRCPYQGTTKRFYFEAKVMELASHCLGRFRPEAPGRAERPTSGDIDRMHHAGHLLTRDLKNPPDPDELARASGTSRTRFFTKFRRVHGVSPLAYLRRARMEHARRLLNRQEMNIAQIAGHLGFSSPSNFARTFKQQYGIPPSLYLNQRRRL